MATDLVTLIAQEKSQKDALEQDISKGAAAQNKLAQVKALVDALSAEGQRRDQLTAGADARLAEAKARAAEVTAGLAPIDDLLKTLPATLKVADLDALVAKDLPTPPDAAKPKYADYLGALIAADGARVAAATALTLAQDRTARAALDVTRAEEALELTLVQAARLADDARAALDEALRAKSARDRARAYFAEFRAKALVARVNAADTSKAVTDAEKALKDKVDAHADAVAQRLTAEAALAQAEGNRSRAADQLGAAATQLLAILADKIANPPAPPPPP